MKQKLDFLVIGAAKSATTTLFEWVKHHPEIYIPANKEVPFYSDKAVYKKGLDWYLDTYFADAKPSQVKGTITPQYMLGSRNIAPDAIANRIKNDFPDIKLVAVLRHPIERAFSHHKMALRRGHTSSSFEDDVIDLMNNKNLEQERNMLSPENNYFLGSEYGRILSYYYELFGKDQILVFYAKNLKDTPKKSLREFFGFIGVDSSFTPPNIEKSYHKGGGKPKIKLLTPSFLFKIPFVKTLWRNYTPHPVRKTIENKINRWNVKADDQSVDRNSDVYKKLVDHYKEDIKLLEEITNTKTPWRDWG